MLKLKKGEANFYPFILWNTKVLGKQNKEISETNIYNIDSDTTNLKTGRIEYLFFKYLPVLFLDLIFSFNLHFTATTGLLGAIIAFLGFKIFNKYKNKSGYLYLFILFILYFTFLATLTISNIIEFKVIWIASYVIKYFIMLLILTIVIENLSTEHMYNVYKISLGKYVRIPKNKKEIKKRSIFTKRVFYVILILFTPILGFWGLVDLTYKFKVNQEAEKRILLKNNNERAIVQKRNSEALIELLEKQSSEVGIRVHTDKDIELLRDDFAKYMEHGIIAYENVVITKNTKIVDADTGKSVGVGSKFKKKLIRAWVKKYKDGFYRWHFGYKGQVFVVMSVKAR